MKTLYPINIQRLRSLSQSLAGFALCLMVTACTNEPAPYKSNISNPRVLFNPMNATASVRAETKNLESLKGDVPVLYIAFGNSNSADVYRCKSSYSLVYGNGLQKLSSLSKSTEEYRSAAKDALRRMTGDLSSCRVVANATTAQTVTDFAATDGKFYYIINPCVTKESSTTKQASCSYMLELTEPIEYVNTRTAYEIEVLSKLTSAEGALYGSFNSMRRALEEAQESKTNCVLQEAAERASQAQLTGMLKVVSTVALAPLVNGFIAGVGTFLDEAVGTLLGMAAPQQITEIKCPAFTEKIEYYNELQAKAVQVTKEVLEARIELSRTDAHYQSVEKQLLILKNNNIK
jgi:hypothetical protein